MRTQQKTKHPIRYRTLQEAQLQINPLKKGDNGWRSAQYEERWVTTENALKLTDAPLARNEPQI